MAFCLSERGATNPAIGEPLAADALQGIIAAHDVIDAELRAGVVAEVEFREVAVQVLLSAVLVDVFHAALEDREHTFDGVS